MLFNVSILAAACQKRSLVSLSSPVISSEMTQDTIISILMKREVLIRINAYDFKGNHKASPVHCLVTTGYLQ